MGWEKSAPIQIYVESRMLVERLRVARSLQHNRSRIQSIFALPEHGFGRTYHAWNGDELRDESGPKPRSEHNMSGYIKDATPGAHTNTNPNSSTFALGLATSPKPGFGATSAAVASLIPLESLEPPLENALFISNVDRASAYNKRLLISC